MRPSLVLLAAAAALAVAAAVAAARALDGSQPPVTAIRGAVFGPTPCAGLPVGGGNDCLVQRAPQRARIRVTDLAVGSSWIKRVGRDGRFYLTVDPGAYRLTPRRGRPARGEPPPARTLTVPSGATVDVIFDYFTLRG